MEKKTIKAILKRTRSVLIILGILLLGVSLFSVYTTDLLKKIVDKLYGRITFEELSKDIFFYVAISILQVAYLYVVNFLSSIYDMKKEMEIKIELMKKVTAKKGAFFNSTNSGELYQMLSTDVSVATEFVINTTIRTMYIVFIFITTVIYLLYLRWSLLLALLLLQPFAILLKTIVAKYVVKYSEAKRNYAGKLADSMQEMFSNPLDKALSGMKKFFLNRTVESLQTRFDVEKKLIKVNCLNGNISELISTLSVCIVVVCGGYAVINRNMGIGTFIVFITYSQKLLSSVESLLDLSIDFSQVKPSLERIAPFFDQEILNEKKETLQVSNPDIIIRGVRFSYNDKEVLRETTYKFEFGKVYGLVGKTGEGKSTLVKLLLNYWDVQQGSFLVGDVNVQDIDNNNLESLIAYYPTDPIIFNDTVYNNIILDKSGIVEDRIYHALRMVDLEETIKKMEMGLESNVGSNGNKLSAGEKQRLALSRIFIEDKKILILDEPTASLDQKTSSVVIKNILQYMSGKLVIIITHDVNLLEHCDKVVHLENGVLI